MVQKRKPSAPFLVECSLVFLAMLVFSWGLQAKLALYHTGNGTICATNSMAKLAVENRPALTNVQIWDRGLPPALPELNHVAAFAFSLHPPQGSSAKLADREPGLRGPGQYYLHGHDLKLRPPPAVC